MLKNQTVEITPELIANHGINDEEYAKILELIGRERPTQNWAFSQPCGMSIALTNPPSFG